MKTAFKIMIGFSVLINFQCKVYAGSCELKKIGQYSYAVVIKGEPNLIGSRIDRFAAYTKRQSRWTRIAHQIDEVNARNDYVLSEGLPYTANSDDRLFDFNDELVISGLDFGESFKKKDIPKELLKDALKIWTIRLCQGSSDFGAILLVYYQNEPFPLLSANKVTFDSTGNTIRSNRYFYRFQKERAALLGDVELFQGQKRVAMFSKSIFRMPIILPWYFPNFEFSDETFTSSIESWQSGPLRTIVAVGVKFKNFLSVLDFHLFSELVFYENALQIPTMIEFKFNPRSYFKPGSGVAYALNFSEGVFWELESNLVDLPLKGANEVMASGKRAAEYDNFYAAGRSKDLGAFFVKVNVDNNAKKDVPPPFYIRREMFGNPQWVKYWGWLKDLAGDLGVYIDFSNVHKGTYNFGLDLVLSSKADEGIPADFDSVETRWSKLDLK